MTSYRQGDVLLVKVDSVPDGATPVARENGLVVLAHGEATGHHHSLRTRSAKLVEHGDERFLVLAKDGTLSHQEHDAIRLPAGSYRVIRQREYSPVAIRQVAD